MTSNGGGRWDIRMNVDIYSERSEMARSYDGTACARCSVSSVITKSGLPGFGQEAVRKV